MQDSAGRDRHLFIVGDLVEYWLGDDTPERTLGAVFDAIAAAAAAGTHVHLMHGNRDFLLGEDLAARLGATLHREDVLQLADGHDADRLIHGHTHRSDIHTHERSGGQPLRRFVLGDWSDEGAQILRWDGDQAEPSLQMV